MRTNRIFILVLFGVFVILTLSQLRSVTRLADTPTSPTSPHQPPGQERPTSQSTTVEHDAAPPISDDGKHPIIQLVREAGDQAKRLLDAQSKTLDAAVKEYRRRYNLPPPPHFDKWYEFARDRKVQLIDEYDAIHHSLLPFWGLDPKVIRARLKEALGFDNSLMGVRIRDGLVLYMQRGDDWQKDTTKGMMKSFLQYLPDMDLAFNLHDEPRVVIPNDDLSRLVEHAQRVATPAALGRAKLRDSFSPRPADADEGKEFEEYRTTRFNRFPHQAAWTNSRMSCPVDSPARALDESAARDDTSGYAFSSIGLVRNRTAFSDVCSSPSLRERYGFFDRPNAFNVVHDLLPVFSQSKVSSFQDILYPSWWYWADKVPYKDKQDVPWDAKIEKLYWRGSTTGGFSRNGGWRRQHRQRIVSLLNKKDDKVKVYSNDDVNVTQSSSSSSPLSTRSDDPPSDPPSKPPLTEAPRTSFANLFDVRFSSVGQCDPGDCEAQMEFFNLVREDSQHRAWEYKYLLDMDGNAYSGRFHAFLRSRSLPFKMALFREWHDEWLRPWLHFVPLSLEAQEYVEVLRFFDRDKGEGVGSSSGRGKGRGKGGSGRDLAKLIAEEGREWANKVLRKEDMEVWMFRLLLEYARVIDDDREIIGFTS